MGDRKLDVDVGPRHFVMTLPDDLEDDDYRARDGGDSKPYWAFLWTSALALSRVIMAGPDLTGKRVIELGAGLGLSGFSAAARGAQVVSTDIRPEAVRLLEKNARNNGVSIEARIVDFYDPPPDLGLFDGVLAADVIYNDGMLGGIVRFMRRHLAPGGLGFLADPYRVMPAGVQGAARLSGLDVSAIGLASPGAPVALYTLSPRARFVGLDTAMVGAQPAAVVPEADAAPPPRRASKTRKTKTAPRDGGAKAEPSPRGGAKAKSKPTPAPRGGAKSKSKSKPTPRGGAKPKPRGAR